MAVPNFRSAGQALKKLATRAARFRQEVRTAVLAASRGLHFSAQGFGNPMHAVADAQHGNAGRQHRRIALWGVLVVHRTGTAGEHDAHRFEGKNLLDASGARHDGAENLLFANAPRDELRVLAAKIQHDHSA